MKVLQEIKVGQEVVYGGSIVKYWKVEKVTKVTKTQITLESGIRFNKRNGKKIGDGDRYSNTTNIKTNGWGYEQTLVTPQEYQNRLEVEEYQKEVISLAKRIANERNWREYSGLSLETLQQVVKLLGLKNEN